MKGYIENIIVVEGKADAAYLSSFIDAEFVITNGYEIPKEEIGYLNEVGKNQKVLILVDPDEAGRDIENRLIKQLNNYECLKVEISKCNRGVKNGIAECDKEEILRVLKPYIIDKKIEKPHQKRHFLGEINFLDKNFRDFFSKKYHLGKCNLKKINVRIDRLNIDNEKILNAWREYHENR